MASTAPLSPQQAPPPVSYNSTFGQATRHDTIRKFSYIPIVGSFGGLCRGANLIKDLVQKKMGISNAATGKEFLRTLIEIIPFGGTILSLFDRHVAKRDAARGETFYQRGLALEKGSGEYPENAIYDFSQAGDLGHPEALLHLGNIYFNDAMKQTGPARVTQLTNARVCYEHAAKLGNAGAQVALGKMYSTGQGVRQDYKKAFELFKASAEQYHPEGLFRFGQYYEFGTVVEKDIVRAKTLYRDATTRGYSNAEFEEAKERLAPQS